MKKFLLASLAVISLASCNNDDDNANEASIVGTWKEAKSVVYSGKDNSVLVSDTPDDCDKKNTYVFSKDGKLTTTIYYNSNGTCKLDEETTSNYSYNSGTKILTTDDGNGEVRKLTATELHFVEEKYDENNDGIADTFVLELTRLK